MKDLYQDEKNRLVDYTWKLTYDSEKNTAMMVNEYGEEMDLTTFSVCLEALENTRYDLRELRYGKSRKEPLDELTRKRFGIRDYQLVTNEKKNDELKEVFEVYSDDLNIFTMDHYIVHQHRKLYDDGFLVYLNQDDSQRVLASLKAFVERSGGDD